MTSKKHILIIGIIGTLLTIASLWMSNRPFWYRVVGDYSISPAGELGIFDIDRGYGFPLKFLREKKEVLEESNSITDAILCLTGSTMRGYDYPKGTYRSVVCVQKVAKDVIFFFVDLLFWSSIVWILWQAIGVFFKKISNKTK